MFWLVTLFTGFWQHNDCWISIGLVHFRDTGFHPWSYKYALAEKYKVGGRCSLPTVWLSSAWRLCLHPGGAACHSRISVCGLVVLSSFLACLEAVRNNPTSTCIPNVKKPSHVASVSLALFGRKHMQTQIWIYTLAYGAFGWLTKGRKGWELPDATVSVSVTALCVAVVIEKFRATPELFPYDASFNYGWWWTGGGGTRTRTAVLLMGHLDVWAYVIQSQQAASNRPSTAGTQLRDNRSAASLHLGGHGSGNWSRQGPKESLS